MENKYNSTKLDAELKAAGLPIVGCSSDGRIDYSREITEQEAQLAQSILDAHDPTPDPLFTPEDKINALWQQIVEGNTDAVDELRTRLAKKGVAK